MVENKIDFKNERLFYLHIPKAGGTTLQTIFGQIFPYSQLYIYDTTLPNESILNISKLNDIEKRKIKIVSGHYSYGFHNYFEDKGAKYFTILRDPIERITSQYHFISRKKDHYLHTYITSNNISLLDYVSGNITKEVNNGMLRQLLGLYVNDNFGYFGEAPKQEEINDEDLAKAIDIIENSFAFIGLTEYFELTLQYLIEILGINRFWFKYNRKNTNKITSGRENKYEISRKEKQTIVDNNLYDIKLYDYVLSKVLNDINKISENKYFNPNALEKRILFLKRIMNRYV